MNLGPRLFVFGFSYFGCISELGSQAEHIINAQAANDELIQEL